MSGAADDWAAEKEVPELDEQRPACEADLAALKEIWLSSFPEDTPADVEAFFEGGFSPQQAMVYTVNGQPVSMLFLLAVPLSLPGEKPLSAGYVYAAATLPTWRGRGIFSSLLLAAHKAAASRGMQAVFLRPAEPSLQAFYQRFGYRPGFFAGTVTLTRQQVEQAAAPASGTGERRYAMPTFFRENWLRQNGFAYPAWDRVFWRYAVNCAAGEYWEAPHWAALCQPSASHMLVRDLLCRDEHLPDFYRHLCRHYRFSSCTLRRPILEGTGQVFGMVCPLSGDADRLFFDCPRRYMGPALD